jgi:nitrite reductase/ring-hydroxylating ferredoxin subunit
MAEFVARAKPGRFVTVARVDDLASGELLGVRLDGHAICLANVDGHFYGVAATCPHLGGPLAQGELKGSVLTCPWHMAQFNVRTGCVLRGPARTDLPTYEVRVAGDEIRVAVPE